MEETIYQRIKKRRMELDMSQEELAKKVGYSHKTAICKIEAGQRKLKEDVISKLAKALDTTPSYLMGWDKEDDDATISDRLLTRYRELDDLDQAMVRRILKCDEDFNKV
uniref:Helix-turn-helix XRE-family like protein n=1 Tax=Myoviridae sp. ctiBE32 TaxID=2826685 RepID=A0A8S5N877_9CAUD|nr:MAG TPA: helix-turn-helix XRE-family like protein [Myoviridae sp. ctiBE32]